MTLDDALNLAWQCKDFGKQCERPEAAEALGIILDELEAAKFNWLTGQAARDVLLAATGFNLAWLEIRNGGRLNKYDVPPSFYVDSFHQCRDLAELLDKFESKHWAYGQAFYLGDLCLINRVEGGSEWEAIRGGAAFDSISFRHQSRDEAQALLERIIAATPEQCAAWEY